MGEKYEAPLGLALKRCVRISDSMWKVIKKGVEKNAGLHMWRASFCAAFIATGNLEEFTVEVCHGEIVIVVVRDCACIWCSLLERSESCPAPFSLMMVVNKLILLFDYRPFVLKFYFRANYNDYKLSVDIFLIDYKYDCCLNRGFGVHFVCCAIWLIC